LVNWSLVIRDWGEVWEMRRGTPIKRIQQICTDLFLVYT